MPRILSPELENENPSQSDGEAIPVSLTTSPHRLVQVRQTLQSKVLGNVDIESRDRV
jgi:hypothetical protein